MNFVSIAIGGAVGAIARYLVSRGINLSVNHPFPVGTLAVNATGSLLIGFLFVLFDRTGASQEARLLWITGFLGAYTTFSSYSLETARLFIEGKYSLAIANFALNNVLCLACVFAGLALCRAFCKP